MNSPAGMSANFMPTELDTCPRAGSLSASFGELPRRITEEDTTRDSTNSRTVQILKSFLLVRFAFRFASSAGGAKDLRIWSQAVVHRANSAVRSSPVRKDGLPAERSHSRQFHRQVLR